MKKLASNATRLLRAVHILGAAIWTGCLASIIYMLVGIGGQTPDSARSLLGLMLDFDYWLIIPAVGLIFLTAVLFGISTNWGFVRYRWVVAKWLIFFAAIIPASLLFIPACESMQAALAFLGEFAFVTEAFQADRTLLLALNIYLFTLSAIMIVISVYKPWGKTKRSKMKATNYEEPDTVKGEH